MPFPRFAQSAHVYGNAGRPVSTGRVRVTRTHHHGRREQGSGSKAKGTSAETVSAGLAAAPGGW